MATLTVTLPLDAARVRSLHAGDIVALHGVLFTARDAAHQRLIAACERNEPLPIPLVNQVIYYVGPAPAKPGYASGPAGPTTSGRMDPYTIPLLELGVRGLIGKGIRSPAVVDALVRCGAVYFAAAGGAAALLARHIVESHVVAYADLGTEAIRALTVRGFPAVVVNDCHGADAYAIGRRTYGRKGGDSA